MSNDCEREKINIEPSSIYFRSVIELVCLNRSSRSAGRICEEGEEKFKSILQRVDLPRGLKGHETRCPSCIFITFEAARVPRNPQPEHISSSSPSFERGRAHFAGGVRDSSVCFHSLQPSSEFFSAYFSCQKLSVSTVGGGGKEEKKLKMRVGRESVRRTRERAERVK
jgi:hypothetical protein